MNCCSFSWWMKEKWANCCSLSFHSVNTELLKFCLCWKALYFVYCALFRCFFLLLFEQSSFERVLHEKWQYVIHSLSAAEERNEVNPINIKSTHRDTHTAAHWKSLWSKVYCYVTVPAWHGMAWDGATWGAAMKWMKNTHTHTVFGTVQVNWAKSRVVRIHLLLKIIK